MTRNVAQFGTDMGPECDCGGTIYSYHVVQTTTHGPRPYMMQAFCYGCHKVTTHAIASMPANAPEARVAHTRSNVWDH